MTLCCPIAYIVKILCNTLHMATQKPTKSTASKQAAATAQTKPKTAARKAVKPKAPAKAKTAPNARKPAPAKPAPRKASAAKPKTAKTAKPAQPGPGRPSSFTPEVIEALCTLIAEGSSGREACAALGVSRSGMHRLLADDKEFQDQYTRARDMQADLLFGEIITIADTPMIGTKEVGKEWGTEVTKADMIEHRRLQVEARKWVTAKLAPKKYGDKLQVGGAEDLPAVKHDVSATVTPAEAYRLLLGAK